MGKKILLATNVGLNGRSHSKDLIFALLNQNYVVHLSYPGEENYFKSFGAVIHNIKINRHSKNIISEIFTVLKYLRLCLEVNPTLVLTYTIKPNIYLSIIGRILNIPVISNITGLGSVFNSPETIVTKLIKKLYRKSVEKNRCIFFQNYNNFDVFTSENSEAILKRACLIPGSGVNLSEFNFIEYPKSDSPLIFLFIGRLTRDKGILELLESFNVLSESYDNILLKIVGKLDEIIIPRYLLNNENVIFYGQQANVLPFLETSHVLVNPSYHEGMANVLLEAASCGRPVLASNIPGCQETFDEGISGLGFEPHSVDSLVNVMKRFIALSYEQKVYMGIAGRNKMEREFNRKVVVDAYIRKIESIIEENDN